MSTTGSRPRSRNGVRWRCPDADPAEIVSVEGMLVTDLRRTLADLCIFRDFVNAVVALDHGVRPWFAMPSGLAVRGSDASSVLARVEGFASRRGVRGARRAIAFCDPRAANAGESLSRVRISELGFPPPNLQVPMPRPDGPADVVDFDWPHHDLFGEFDGRGKYFSPEFARGLSAEEIILREKVREDRIRRRHRRFEVRWGWSELMHPQRLLTALTEAGLPASAPGPARSEAFGPKNGAKWRADGWTGMVRAGAGGWVWVRMRGAVRAAWCDAVGRVDYCGCPCAAFAASTVRRIDTLLLQNVCNR